jgi:hypothetical protein
MYNWSFVLWSHVKTAIHVSFAYVEHTSLHLHFSTPCAIGVGSGFFSSYLALLRVMSEQRSYEQQQQEIWGWDRIEVFVENL